MLRDASVLKTALLTVPPRWPMGERVPLWQWALSVPFAATREAPRACQVLFTSLTPVRSSTQHDSRQ